MFNYQRVHLILIDMRTIIRNWTEKNLSLKSTIINITTNYNTEQ